MKTTARKALSTILALAITLGVVAFAPAITASADYAYSGGGAGTLADPYVILTETDLKNVKDTNKCFALGADINLTAAWEPLNGFAGKLDGQGFSINNLYVPESAGKESAGLFGEINGSGVIIQNLTINIKSGEKVFGKVNAGGLFGYIYGDRDIAIGPGASDKVIISDIRVSGNVESWETAGGIGGWVSTRRNNADLDITYCSFTGNVKAIISDTAASDGQTAKSGGLLGLAAPKSIKLQNSFVADGTVSANVNITPDTYVGSNELAYAGGLVGFVNTISVEISDCYVTSNVWSNVKGTCEGRSYGRASGLVSAANSCSIKRCYVACDIAGVKRGTFCLSMWYSQNAPDTASIVDSYYYSPQLPGGPSDRPENSSQEIVSQGTSLKPDQMRNQNSFKNWDFNNVWGIKSGENNGFPTLRRFWVKGMQISATRLTLEMWKTHNLTASLLPADAPQQTLIWSTSDQSVATVDNGTVTSKQLGKARIRVTNSAGTFTRMCEVNVVPPAVPVTGVRMTSTNATIYRVGNTCTLSAIVEPKDASYKETTWTSSNTAVATVSAYGTDSIVTAKTPGTATITVTTVDGGFTSTCEVEVIPPTPVASVSIQADGKQPLLIGESINLFATFSPWYATLGTDLTWTVLNNNSNIVSIDQLPNSSPNAKKITALSNGTATIRVTSGAGPYKDYKVTVMKPPSDMKMSLVSTSVMSLKQVAITVTDITQADLSKDARVFIISPKPAPGAIKDTAALNIIAQKSVTVAGTQTFTFEDMDLGTHVTMDTYGDFEAALYINGANPADAGLVARITFNVASLKDKLIGNDIVIFDPINLNRAVVAPGASLNLKIAIQNNITNPRGLQELGAGAVIAMQGQPHNVYMQEIKLGDANAKTGALAFSAPRDEGAYVLRIYSDVKNRSEATLISETPFTVSAKAGSIAGNLEAATNIRRGGKYNMDDVDEFEATAVASGVRLAWPSDPDALYYRVYRSNVGGEQGATVADPAIYDTKYVDVNVDAATTYHYTVRAVLKESDPATGEDETLGDPSEQLSVTTLAEILGGNASDAPGKLKNVILMAIDDPVMSVNGLLQEIDPGRGTKPLIANNRTIVPIRAIVEAMLGDVDWDDADRMITLEANGHTVKMWLDKKDLIADGKPQTMDIAPAAMNSRTMVPLRFSAENLGCHVDWLSETREIVIVY